MKASFALLAVLIASSFAPAFAWDDDYYISRDDAWEADSYNRGANSMTRDYDNDGTPNYIDPYDNDAYRY
ncbi:MAG: hypothetical protein J5I81_12635 [Nitrococcus mobilis]|nr:hypothetical protein [Nitrococcus mobilis]